MKIVRGVYTKETIMLFKVVCIFSSSLYPVLSTDPDTYLEFSKCLIMKVVIEGHFKYFQDY